MGESLVMPLAAAITRLLSPERSSRMVSSVASVARGEAVEISAGDAGRLNAAAGTGIRALRVVKSWISPRSNSTARSTSRCCTSLGIGFVHAQRNPDG